MRRSSLTLTTVLLVSCGSGELPPVPAPTEVSIFTTGGESLELDDGTTVAFPDGAFEVPTEVVLRRVQCGGIYRSPAFDSCLYDVSFLEAPKQRYTVNISGDERGLTDEGFRHIGILAEDTLSQPMALVSMGGSQTSGCVDPGFIACGGDLLGDWETDYACGAVSRSSYFRNPFEGCEEDHYLTEYPFTSTQRISFKSNNTFERRGSFQVRKREFVTQACLDVIGESCGPGCTMDADVCKCEFDKGSGDSAGGDYWSYDPDDANRFQFNPVEFQIAENEGEEEFEPIPPRMTEYCVQGDTLSVRDVETGAVTIYHR